MIIEKMTPPSDKTRDSSESSATLLSANDSGDESRSSSPGFPSSISDSRRPSAVEIPTLERPGLYQQEALIERVPNPMAEKCLPWCSCSCHARRSFTTPLILRTVLGEINVQYRGKRQECDEFNCRRSANFSLSLKYDLPKYLMSRYIVMAMRCVPLEGPQLSLRMPRVMRWSHPLWNYANSNDVLAIQKLFSEGKASPHDVNPHGSNALIYAAGHNNLQLSQFLLQQSADPDLPNGYGRTAAEMLWERSFAGHLGPEDTCRIGIMLKDHDNVETWRFSTLHKIVLGLVYRDLRSELDVSTASLNAGDSWGRTPLCWAAIRNDLNSLNILLEFGADSNATDESGHTPLHFVQSAEVCTALLAAKININILNEGSKSPLHQFCRGIVRRDLRPSSVSVIDLLIDAGIPVNVRDDSGETPLMNAIHAGLLDYARRLVFHGADPNAFNYGWGGDTAIHFAVRWDRWEIIPLLLEKGADYTALNFSDRNIAHLATQCGSARTMSVLASSSLTQLDVSLKDKNGMTPGEYMAERLICAESEEGIREEYQRLLGSIPAEKIASARVSSTGTLIDLESQADLKGCHVPGAFLDHFDGISVS